LKSRAACLGSVFPSTVSQRARIWPPRAAVQWHPNFCLSKHPAHQLANSQHAALDIAKAPKDPLANWVRLPSPAHHLLLHVLPLALVFSQHCSRSCHALACWTAMATCAAAAAAPSGVGSSNNQSCAATCRPPKPADSVAAKRPPDLTTLLPYQVARPRSPQALSH